LKVLPAKSKELKIAIAHVTSSIGSKEHIPVAATDDYEDLKIKLFTFTLILSGLIFVGVAAVYGLQIALNYLLGACTGVVYLKMLAKSVDQLGSQTKRLGYSRLGVFIILIIVSTRLEQLQILPIFLGFLTYKAAILVYLAQDLMRSPSN
jgi:ATP synthase protein I